MAHRTGVPCTCLRSNSQAKLPFDGDYVVYILRTASRQHGVACAGTPLMLAWPVLAAVTDVLGCELNIVPASDAKPTMPRFNL